MKETFRKIFGCDARSLAIFRFALAFLVLYDVCDRFPDAEAFYSDSGFFDTEFSKEESPDSYSLNYISGSTEFQQAIFVALGISAVLLGIGYGTRWATIACWILLVSVHVRNPFVLIGGDTLLRMMLFWSMFIPLGSAWSVDRWRKLKKDPAGNAPPSGTIFCAGTVCLIIQLCIMYWCAGICKLNDAWFAGTAMEYVLRLDLYVRPFGEWVLTQPFLLKAIAYGTLVVELGVPFLLFLPFRNTQFRMLAILVMVGLHFGIELSMDVGNFGIVSMIAWLPLVPGCIWRGCRSEPVSIEVTAEKVLPRSHPLISGSIYFLNTVVPLFFLAYLVLWNYYGLNPIRGTAWQPKLDKKYFWLGWSTMVAQNFQMFGDPPEYNPIYVFNGRTRAGKEVDLIRNLPSAESRPGGEASHLGTPQWKKIHRFLLRNGGHQKFHQALLEYYTRVWNRSQGDDEQLAESQLECYLEKIGPEFQEGAFVRRPDLAHWKTPDKVEKTEDELIEDIDSFLQGLDNGPMIPLGN